MTRRADFEDRLRDAAAASGIALEALRVQEDPYRGFRVYAVSTGFAGRARSERESLLFGGVNAGDLQWVELYTPEEAEWAGPPPAAIELESIPMWPEALARPAQGPLLFGSDLDFDLPIPIVASFYSLKGGVGRSTALAYAARILAARGHRVLCIDMDLEAPGLAALFGREAEVAGSMGVVDVLLKLTLGDDVDLLDHVLRLSDSDELYLLPAGLPSADYARRLRLLDPEAWYREENNPLHVMLDLAANLPFRPQAILIDSRTGISPISAPLLFDVSDIAVVTLFPHPQARAGTEALVNALLAAKSRREHELLRLTPEPRFLISPVPAGTTAEAEKYRLRALDWIGDWLEPIEGLRGSEPVEPEDITHFVAYQQAVATSDQLLAKEEQWRPYSVLADWVERFLPTGGDAVSANLTSSKGAILKELFFSTGTAENQQDLLAAFVHTDVVDAALRSDKPLVLGRKGTGKTAIFRWIAEGHQGNFVTVVAPSALRQESPWSPTPDSFASISRILEKNGNWRELWSTHTALSVHLSLRRSGMDVDYTCPAGLEASVRPLLGRRISEKDVVAFFRHAMGAEDVGLNAWAWLGALDDVASPNTLMVLDGLDTGFGNSQTERVRRSVAIEGLFAFLLDREADLQHLRFKVLLREDIWRNLRFENKSHLFGRSVRLEWRTQADYFKTVLIQAVRRSKAFVATVTDYARDLEDVAAWTEEETFRVWNALVGERMRGGKTAFTRTWVWNRLADGNNDHAPRSLLDLFQTAVEWERRENPESSYDRSVLRPRSLSASLDTASTQAVQALQEEFKELDVLIDRLQKLGRSPLIATELEDLPDEVRLAREVGLLQVYEGTEEEVSRYRIPDLYRVGLGITRRGPG